MTDASLAEVGSAIMTGVAIVAIAALFGAIVGVIVDWFRG